MKDETGGGVITNREVVEIALSVPPGHKHLRAILSLSDGNRIVLQEATVANLVRAYVTLITHPTTREIRLVGREVMDGLKEGFAPWQLIEPKEPGEGEGQG